jgi:uncharacterized membrane protein YccC
MQWPGPRDWMFASKTFLAGILALYIAFSLGLERPYWAMASAYIASQPLSGATRSRAVYRLAGTLVGAAAAVVLVPALVNAPPLLSLVLALWVAGCLYVSLLDRTPRSYVCMLAGYTAAIIGFPSVSAPDAIFTTALTRVEEIALGVTLASVIASVVFPRPVGPALIGRIDTWLGNARRWSTDVLCNRDAARVEARRLAADGLEINLLASQLSYDSTAWETQVFSLLRARMIMLIPVLASIADRMSALRTTMPQPVAALAADLAEWISATSSRSSTSFLMRIDELQASVASRPDWDALLLTSLLMRLRELVLIMTDCAILRRQMAAGRPPAETELTFAPEAWAALVWHRDHGMALLSAMACALAVVLCCTAWIATAWPDGAVAAEMVAVACSFFATLDDPVPAILQFLAWSAIAVIVDGILLFGVLPAVTAFPTLMLVLAPPFLVAGVLVALPATTSGGRAFLVNGSTLLALQSTYDARFASFANGAVAFLLGLALAAVVTQLIRSVGAGFSARRLLRVIWLELAAAAENRGRRDRARYAGLMLDRLGLIAPRLAEAESDDLVVGALADIRVGFNVIDLRRARHEVTRAVRDRLDAMLDTLALSYRARAERDARPDAKLLSRIDEALEAVTEADSVAGRPDALLGLVGIRRGLFPDAPPAAWSARQFGGHGADQPQRQPA